MDCPHCREFICDSEMSDDDWDIDHINKMADLSDCPKCEKPISVMSSEVITTVLNIRPATTKADDSYIKWKKGRDAVP